MSNNQQCSTVESHGPNWIAKKYRIELDPSHRLTNRIFKLSNHSQNLLISQFKSQLPLGFAHHCYQHRCGQEMKGGAFCAGNEMGWGCFCKKKVDLTPTKWNKTESKFSFFILHFTYLGVCVCLRACVPMSVLVNDLEWPWMTLWLFCSSLGKTVGFGACHINTEAIPTLTATEM